MLVIDLVYFMRSDDYHLANISTIKRGQALGAGAPLPEEIASDQVELRDSRHKCPRPPCSSSSRMRPEETKEPAGHSVPDRTHVLAWVLARASFEGCAKSTGGFVAYGVSNMSERMFPTSQQLFGQSYSPANQVINGGSTDNLPEARCKHGA